MPLLGECISIAPVSSSPINIQGTRAPFIDALSGHDEVKKRCVSQANRYYTHLQRAHGKFAFWKTRLWSVHLCACAMHLSCQHGSHSNVAAPSIARFNVISMGDTTLGSGVQNKFSSLYIMPNIGGPPRFLRLCVLKQKASRDFTLNNGTRIWKSLTFSLFRVCFKSIRYRI